ncbi:MAG: HAD family phosphatase [Anaerolineaceae bacterium]
MIKGIIFDFDGLIIDTEVGDYQAWLEIYQEYGLDYPLAEWQRLIGIYSAVPIPLDRLDRLKGPIDRELIDSRRRQRSIELSIRRPLLPGVMDYLIDTQRLGLKTAIASSSPRVWLDRFLEPRNLSDYFDIVVTGDTVSQVKPSPELFLSAIKQLGITAPEALILEDSLNGLMAARSAGIHCVIVPSRLTRGLDFHEANLVLESLDSLPLIDLLKHFGGHCSKEEERNESQQ